MGKLALAAKITHVPSMYLCEFPGPNFGKRDAAVAGHKEIDRRCRALGVDVDVDGQTSHCELRCMTN